MTRHVRVAVALTLVVAGTACGVRGKSVKFTTTRFLAQEAISAADQARLDDNCPDGAPKALPDWPIGKTEMIYRDGYVLEHSSEWKVPYWVCESLESDELHGNVPRKEPFDADKALTPGLRAELTDYKFSGFDRGHQAPAGDQTQDARLKNETFLLSNMVPQNGNQNQQIWNALEARVRGWAEQPSTATGVKVLTGPVFHTEDEVKNGFSLIETIGKNHVGVPRALYKIVVGVVGGEQRAVAFLIANTPQGKGPYDFASFIVTVQSLETLTGFNFMPSLDVADRVRLETQKGTLFN